MVFKKENYYSYQLATSYIAVLHTIIHSIQKLVQISACCPAIDQKDQVLAAMQTSLLAAGV